MGLRDITRASVFAAIAEHDRLGRAAFLARYRFGRARKFFVLHDNELYDSKALVGAAHQHATGTALSAGEFSGGERTVVARLTSLGFDVRDRAGLGSELDPKGYIGEVPGLTVGDPFADRDDARGRGAHRAPQGGIVGTGERGAESIVVSGGYEDDEDHGDMIIYTGHGGQHPQTKQQIADQTFDASGNAALRTSMLTGAPVRVIRGADPGSPHAPQSGLRYDGLFRVEDAWRERGKSGYLMCRYRLVALDAPVVAVGGAGFPVDGAADPEDTATNDGQTEFTEPTGNKTPGRKLTSAARLVRSVQVAEYVKRLHAFTCQACGIRLSLGGDRPYAEAAHIRALGRPHNGPDVPENVLCLCPNCHVLFDSGGLIIDESLQVHVSGSPVGALRLHPSHDVNASHLTYHRAIHA